MACGLRDCPTKASATERSPKSFYVRYCCVGVHVVSCATSIEKATGHLACTLLIRSSLVGKRTPTCVLVPTGASRIKSLRSVACHLINLALDPADPIEDSLFNCVQFVIKLHSCRIQRCWRGHWGGWCRCCWCGCRCRCGRQSRRCRCRQRDRCLGCCRRGGEITRGKQMPMLPSKK